MCPQCDLEREIEEERWAGLEHGMIERELEVVGGIWESWRYREGGGGAGGIKRDVGGLDSQVTEFVHCIFSHYSACFFFLL